MRAYRVEEVMAAISGGRKTAIAYLSEVYVARTGFPKLTNNGFVVFDTAGPGVAHETEMEKIIRKNWSRVKRRV